MKEKIRKTAYGCINYLLDQHDRDVRIVKSIRSNSVYIYSNIGKIRVSDHENKECSQDYEILVDNNKSNDEIMDMFAEFCYEADASC